MMISAVFPSLVNEAGVAVYSHDFHGEIVSAAFRCASKSLIKPNTLPLGHGKSEPREEKGKAYIVR